VETKPNGIGVDHKIEEEVEAKFQKVKIGDLCSECGE
jgi:hypothetical protein